MTQQTSYKRKSISLDSDIAASLEAQAVMEHRSFSNLVNMRLRSLMPASAKKPRKQKGGVK